MNDIVAGTTSKSIFVLLTKTTDGTETTGVAFGSATAQYTREGQATVNITLSALSALTDAYSSGGWKEVVSSQQGLYRLDVPDAAFASGANSVVVSVKVTGSFIYFEKFDIKSASSAEVMTRLGVAGAGLTALGDTRIANLDAAVSTRLATSGYTAPSNASIATILADYARRTGDYATAANVSAVETKVDTVIAATDTLETSATTITNATDTLEASAATIVAATDTVETSLAAIKAKTDTIGAGRVTVTSPVISNSRIELVKGDDYYSVDGRALTFLISDTGFVAADITSVTFSIGSNPEKFRTTGTVVDSGSDLLVTVELSKTETNLLGAGHNFYLVLYLDTTHIATELIGEVKVLPGSGLTIPAP